MASIISTMLAGCGAGQRKALTASSPAGLRLVSAPASQSPRAGLMRAGGCDR